MDKSRTELLIGRENLQKLSDKHITIVGTGGVGGYVAMMLLRAGVEKFKLIDFDIVSPSNANRQIIANNNTIGKSKVDVLKQMMLEINENAKISTSNERLTRDNIENLVNNTDIVVDAIDSVQDKADLIVYCKKNNIYVISAMGAGNRYDLPNFYLTDIYNTHDDGLAKVIRKKLREQDIKNLDVVTSSSKPATTGRVVASISYYPAVCGCVLASAIVNKIIKEEI